MSSHAPEHEHEQKSKAHQPHATHEEAHKGPHDPDEVNPKLASDIAYWSHEFGVSGDKLHEAIRTHGTKIAKLRPALHK